MLRKSVFLLVLIAMLTVQAQAGDVITDLVRRNGSGGAPVISPDPLANGLKVLTNRNYVFTDVPELLVGADWIQMTMDDRTAAAVEYDVTLGVPATLYLLIDGRVGDGSNANPPTFGSKMQWVVDMGFELLEERVAINESGVTAYYVYALSVPRGTVTLREQNSGSISIYTIAALPGGPLVQARGPSPKDGLPDVIRDVVLSWKPGEFAATHDVYLGRLFDDVNNADTTSQWLVSPGQTDTTYAPTLEFGKQYFWRVDEVNAAPDFTPYKGNVWSFTVEPYAYKITKITATASSEEPEQGPGKTVDGSGLDGIGHGTDKASMWQTSAGLPAWIQYEFDRVYKLHEMLVWNTNQSTEAFPVASMGAKDVIVEYATDANDWQVLSGVSQLACAPGALGYEPQKIDLGGVAASKVRITINSIWGLAIPQTGLSEVQFFQAPVWARDPQPTSGKTGIDPTAAVTMDWRPGRDAVSHDVYLGIDADAVADGTAAFETVDVHSYTPADVELERTYYWKVNEVNPAEVVPTWEGAVWNFSTVKSLTVENFESYKNESPNQVFQAWTDGLPVPADKLFAGRAGNGTGSEVGYNPRVGNIMETGKKYTGKQSMPLWYEGGVSETVYTIPGGPADWTKHGITTLVLYFYGDPGNTAGELYVKVNDVEIPYAGDISDVAQAQWNPFNADLTNVPAATLESVTTLTIGIRGGEGLLFIDDILLRRTPVLDSDPAVLVAYYAMEDSVTDGSGNGNDGTVIGAPVYVDGQVGKALQFNGSSDCVDLGNKPVFNFTNGFSLSVWANITTWSGNWGCVMVGNRGENSVGWQLRKPDSNKLCFTTRGTGNEDMRSNLNAPVGEWVHIAAVYDCVHNTKRIYVNGVQDSVASTNADVRVTPTTHNTYIGARANGGNTSPESRFTGILDEVRIYSGSLSAGEVESLFNPTP